jgi:hypothetical protein
MGVGSGGGRPPPRKGGSVQYRHGQRWAFGDGGTELQWRSQKLVKEGRS